MVSRAPRALDGPGYSGSGGAPRLQTQLEPFRAQKTHLGALIIVIVYTEQNLDVDLHLLS